MTYDHPRQALRRAAVLWRYMYDNWLDVRYRAEILKGLQYMETVLAMKKVIYQDMRWEPWGGTGVNQNAAHCPLCEVYLYSDGGPMSCDGCPLSYTLRDRDWELPEDDPEEILDEVLGCDDPESSYYLFCELVDWDEDMAMKVADEIASILEDAYNERYTP